MKKLAALLAGGLLASGMILTTGPMAQAAPSTNCWAYAGGNSSWGSCLGSPFGGTYYKVHTKCAWSIWTWDAAGSNIGYASPGRAGYSVQGGSCGWGTAFGAWVENW